nr:hypothetical protein [Tanacetum cinerariifolium]
IRSEGALIQSIDPPLSIGYIIGSGEDRMEHDIELTDLEPQTPHDSPVSGGHTPRSDEGGSTAETVSTARLDINAARPEVSTAEPKTPPTTATLFDDEDVTIADTLKERERQQEASKAALAEMCDEVQAQIYDDHEFTVRSTHEEQEKYTVEERSKLLAEFIKRRKKQLGKERAETIKSKPPIKTQLRNLKMTYLKHTGRFTHAQLKSRSFEEIQKLYIKEQKWVHDFIPIRSKEDEKRIGSRKKRAASLSLKYKSPKKQKVNDQESEDKEHRKCLKVVPDDDKVIDYETLDVKSVIIDFLDRQDVLDLHKIIMGRFPANDLEEKRYPLTKEILEKMLSSRLKAETESTLALDLIKFIKLQIEEKGWGDNLTVDQVRKRAISDNDDYVCRGLILNA